jgi:hypothetical protein
MFLRTQGISRVVSRAGVRSVVGVYGVLDKLAIVTEDNNSKKLYLERLGRYRGIIGERKR